MKQALRNKLFLVSRYQVEYGMVVLALFCAVFTFFSGFPKKGELHLEDSLVYKGELVHGHIEGKGEVFFSNGDVYKGEFKNGLFDGKGVFRSAKGWYYQGEFYKGKPDGKGKLTTEHRVIYKGRFKQGAYQHAN